MSDQPDDAAVACEQIYAANQGRLITGQAIRDIYCILDTLLLDSKFDVVNKTLTLIDCGKLQPEMLVGVLTITFRARDKLSARSDLFTKIKTMFDEKFGLSRSKEILRGLD
jgi:hypothetical protein